MVLLGKELERIVNESKSKIERTRLKRDFIKNLDEEIITNPNNSNFTK